MSCDRERRWRFTSDPDLRRTVRVWSGEVAQVFGGAEEVEAVPEHRVVG